MPLFACSPALALFVSTPCVYLALEQPPGAVAGYTALMGRAMAAAGAEAMTEAFKAAGLHDAFYVVPGVSLALALVLLAGARTVTADMAKLQRWMSEGAGDTIRDSRAVL